MANVDKFTQYLSQLELIKSYQDLTVSNGQWAASLGNGGSIDISGFYAPTDPAFTAYIYNNGQYSQTGINYYNQLPRLQILTSNAFRVFRYSNGAQPLPHVTASGTLATLRVLEFNPDSVVSVQSFLATPSANLPIASVDPNKCLVFWTAAVLQNSPSYSTGPGFVSGGSWYFVNNTTLGWRAVSGLISNMRMYIIIVETI